MIRRAGGFTDRAYLKGALYTRALLKEVEQAQVNEFVRSEEQKLLAAAGTVVVGADKEEAVQSKEIVDLRRELLKALASRVTTGRMVVQLDRPEKMENTPADVLLDDGDILRVPQRPSSVFVLGAVRASTSVQYKEGESVSYYIGRVGGFTKQADQKELNIVKADGSAVSGFANIRSVEPGDAIVVPPKEEEKVRLLPTFRDVMTILGQTALTIAALAAIL